MKKLFCALLFICLCMLGACGETQSGAPDATPASGESQLYGLDFTEEEIQSAVAAAKQYYTKLASEEIDASLLSEDEVSELEERNQWLEQGVQVEYREEDALRYITGSGAKDTIAEKGAGTVIILQATVPAAPEDSAWNKRVMELDRDSAQSAWYFRTEGPL
ncbi:MAG: hypothetical protein ACI3XD_07200 [Oscillospiraceae bacterium]